MTEPSSFKQFDLPGVIDTASTEFVAEFYDPLLSTATEYKRGVGYFSSSWIRSAARGMTNLAETGGTAKWLTSPQLSEADWEAIRAGADARDDDRLKQTLEETVADLEQSLTQETATAMAWLIADGIVDLRFAVPTDGQGDFHDKWGVVTDTHGNRVAFHGSQNDSLQGQRNYESYDIFCDWSHDRDADRVDAHERRFDRLWDSDVEGVDIYEVPDAVRAEIVALRDDNERPYDLPADHPATSATPDHGITLRDYQQEAVDAWRANGNRGLFEMATGTGKTYTAIGAMDGELHRSTEPMVVVITAPMTHIAHQWIESLADFGYENPRLMWGTENPNWKADLATIVGDVNLGLADEELIVTTHDTGSAEMFRDQISSLDCSTMIIADEVHNLGSPQRQKGLLTTFDDRLGLSATPTRYFDDDGTDVLMRYFDDVVYEYSLADAIPEHLVSYNYYPQLVELTADELQKYRLLSHQLAKVQNAPGATEEDLTNLLIKRAQILKSAERKFEELDSLIDTIDIDHLLVYTNYEQIDEIQGLLADRGVIQHKFTNEEDSDERQQLLSGFADGRYDALVAMKCLDEGVDVPSTKQAILMSNSKNPKQFVQRRGRVLRQHKGKDRAEIYDMIVVPSLDPDRELVESEKGILQGELERFKEFAETADNAVEAKLAIQKLRRIYEV